MHETVTSQRETESRFGTIKWDYNSSVEFQKFLSLYVSTQIWDIVHNEIH